MADLQLTRDQRRRLAKLEPVRIAGTGTCPVQPGHTMQIVLNVTLTVDKVRPVKGGGWSLGYTLKDRRDLEKARHLRSTPPLHKAKKGGKPPTPESIAQAREESSYTSLADSMDAGHAPPSEWLDKHAAERRSGDAARRLRAREGQLQDALERCESAHTNLRRLARETGMDVRSDIRVVERRIEAIKTKIEKAA